VYSTVKCDIIRQIWSTSKLNSLRQLSKIVFMFTDGKSTWPPYYTVSQKNCAKLFLSPVRQMSTNFDNFWPADSTEDRFM